MFLQQYCKTEQRADPIKQNSRVAHESKKKKKKPNLENVERRPLEVNHLAVHVEAAGPQA